MGLKNQVLDLLGSATCLRGTGTSCSSQLCWRCSSRWFAIRPRSLVQRGWRLPLLAALDASRVHGSAFDMGYMGYIHTRALPFLVLLAIASPPSHPARKTGAILAAVVALQIGYQVHLAASYRAFDREAQAAELHHVLGAARIPASD